MPRNPCQPPVPPPPARPERVEPVPPGNHPRYAGHHWLEVRNSDGHTFGMVVLQWSPTMQRWFSSGALATSAKPRETTYWRWVAEAVMPPVGA